MKHLGINSVVNIVDSDLKRIKAKGYDVEKNVSHTTKSVYYTLSNGKSSFSFRISDHPTYRDNINTLNVSRYNVTSTSVHRFVDNKIRGMHYRFLNNSLNGLE